MQAVLTLPSRMVHYLIRVQEIKPYNFYVLLAFCVFTGFTRGLEEIILFDIQLKSSEVFVFVHFYLSLAVILTAGISHIGRLPWQKVMSVILVGIFLGIFPPVLDILIPQQTQVFYGFFFVHDWQQIPWLGYKPEFNYPPGECITIWLSIFFSGYYVFYKSRSYARSLGTALYAYTGFMVFGSFLPMLVTYLVAGYVPSPQYARQLDENLLRAIIYYNAFAQIMLASVVYLIMRRPLLLHLIRRSLHPLPFVTISLIGSAICGKLNGHAFLAAAVIFWGGWMNLLQNRLYDLEDDRTGNQEKITEEDVHFFNTAFLLAVIAIFFTGNRLVLPVILMYPLTFLYNHPAYRGKKKFPTNLKIEGMWGLGAFVTGSLATTQQTPASFPLMCLLVFGGYSLIAALKDAKDVRTDRRSGTQTLYLKLMASGLSFRRTHQLLLTICILAFLIPPVIFAFLGEFLIATLLGGSTLLSAIPLFSLFPGKKWFALFLLFTFIYLLQLLVFAAGNARVFRA